MEYESPRKIKWKGKNRIVRRTQSEDSKRVVKEENTIKHLGNIRNWRKSKSDKTDDDSNVVLKRVTSEERLIIGQNLGKLTSMENTEDTETFICFLVKRHAQENFFLLLEINRFNSLDKPTRDLLIDIFFRYSFNKHSKQINPTLNSEDLLDVYKLYPFIESEEIERVESSIHTPDYIQSIHTQRVHILDRVKIAIESALSKIVVDFYESEIWKERKKYERTIVLSGLRSFVSTLKAITSPKKHIYKLSTVPHTDKNISIISIVSDRWISIEKELTVVFG